MEGVGVEDEGGGICNGLVDGDDDVVGDDNRLVVGEGAGAGGLRMNEGEREGERREKVFREF